MEKVIFLLSIFISEMTTRTALAIQNQKSQTPSLKLIVVPVILMFIFWLGFVVYVKLGLRKEERKEELKKHPFIS